MKFIKAALLLLFPISVSTRLTNFPSDVQSPLFQGNASPKTPRLEIHIMSLCPDARYCFQTLIHPALKQLSDLDIPINFTLSTICRPHPNNDDVTCPHGPLECLGDTAHLCALRLYPYPSSTHGIDLSKCLLDSYQLIPHEGFFRDCAKTAGVQFDELNKCMSSLEPTEGVGMLRKSCERSQRAGVRVSCTVRVSWNDGDEEDDKMKVVCVRDAATWKGCKHKYGNDGKDLDFSDMDTLVGYFKHLSKAQKQREERGKVEDHDTKM